MLLCADPQIKTELVADSALRCLTLDVSGFGELLELVQHTLARQAGEARTELASLRVKCHSALQVPRHNLLRPLLLHHFPISFP